MRLFEVMETLGERVRRLRKEYGWSEARLEVESGISARHIQRIESGQTRDPRRATLFKLARALRISIAVLMGDDDAAQISEKGATTAAG